jgi:hypothetical protein
MEQVIVLDVNGCEVCCEYSISETPETEETPVVEVSDPTDSSMLREALMRDLEERFWMLGKEFVNKIPNRACRIFVADAVEVDFYDFSGFVTTEIVQSIGETLALFYDSLRMPTMWCLDSIQFRERDEPNPKNGERFRGKEFPSQRRFELFPACLDSGKYRGTLSCTWLEGAVIHEATHVFLEPHLQPLWDERAAKLGWIMTGSETCVRLPGGSVVRDVNIEPQRCPSTYAALQRNDDRAESVVAHLIGFDELDPLRASLVEEVLKKPFGERKVFVEDRTPVLPKIPIQRYRVRKQAPPCFRLTGSKKMGPPVQEYTLAEYLEKVRRRQTSK